MSKETPDLCDDIPIQQEEKIEMTEWRCHFWGDHFIILASKKDEPNWFQRWFGKIFLGLEWTKGK